MKFDFLNSSGETLSGRLELPPGEAKAFALFAHCFTCSKDFVAANFISKTLTQAGIGVLRFDFTGLGNSQGDFSNTNFSSNVDDLISACAALGKQFRAPELLVGHSLGGAAVLKAATLLPDVKAVATVGAPSCVGHVAHLFEKDIAEINEAGSANVKLAGRPFTIKKQFIDDINEAEVLRGVTNFKKALLVMHSPVDDTVSIDHAGKIFAAAKHPKSFVSLDNANHLLIKKENAVYTAQVIGAWAKRYLGIKDKIQKTSVAKNTIVTRARLDNKFTQDVMSSDHKIIVDEPPSVKGDNLGMSPYDLLLSALGACTSMTLKMYAERKKISLSSIEVSLQHEKIHAEDCESCETEKGKVDRIVKTIKVDGPNLTSEQKNRLHEIAEMCPVNRTLNSEILIESHHE